MSVMNQEQLRQEHYNAKVVGVERIHSDLMLLRVRYDAGRVHFLPGQYTVLGLGNWEPRVPETQPEQPDDVREPKLIRRAYSISCSLINESDQLVLASQEDILEFYITLVRHSDSAPPALTPRLFHLQPGDRIYLSPKAYGHYGIEHLKAEDNVVLLGTGTGEAPHNAMLTELLSRGHTGQIVVSTCVRYRKDLAYTTKHRILEQRFPNYQYRPLTTREPENLNPDHPSFVGKRYLQDYIESGEFERETSLSLNPTNCQIFLCGSPDMIGVPIRTHGSSKRYPDSIGMIEILEGLGFEIDHPHHPGNIHFEKYW